MPYRDLKDFLSVIQHLDPDGDLSAGWHGGGPLAGLQCADAHALRGPEPLACHRGPLLWLHHTAANPPDNRKHLNIYMRAKKFANTSSILNNTTLNTDSAYWYLHSTFYKAGLVIITQAAGSFPFLQLEFQPCAALENAKDDL